MAQEPQPRIRGRSRRPIFFIDASDLGEGNATNNEYVMPEITESFSLLHNEQQLTINGDNLVEIRLLGRGNFSPVVMLCHVKNHPELKMAVKWLSLNPRTNDPNAFTTGTDLRMIRAISCTENPYFPTYFGAFRDNSQEQLAICMEACSVCVHRFSKSMHQLKETSLIETFLKLMMKHVSEALAHLKSKNILHRDVKPSNILFNEEPIRFKLCDFGVSATMEASIRKTAMKGTYFYLAPECINSEFSPSGYGIQSDMWSLGISALQIASNEHPFQKMTPLIILNELNNWNPQRPNTISELLWQLIISLLQVNHADRPRSYDAILTHPVIPSSSHSVTEGEHNQIQRILKHAIEQPID